MNKKTAQLFLLLALIAVGISACGRSGPEATPILLRPTFTPTPAAPIVIHAPPGQPGAPGPMPPGTQAGPPAGLIQPGSVMVAPASAAIESAADSTVSTAPTATQVATPVVTAVVTTAVTTANNTEVMATSGAEIQPEAAVQPDENVEQPGPGGQAPDLAAAAAELGVSEDALEAALGEQGQGPPDFAAVAAELGVTEEALMAVIDGPQDGKRPAGGPPSN